MSGTYDMRCRKLPLESAGIINLCKGFLEGLLINLTEGLISEGDYNGIGKSCSKQEQRSADLNMFCSYW